MNTELQQTSAQQKVAIVTGAGSGIGRACALRFAQAGWALVAADLNEGGAAATCRKIEQSGGKAIAQVVDITCEDSCVAMAQSALDTWGRIDALVANAGVQIGGSLLEATAEQWDTILGVNSRGTANSCKAVLPAMLAREGGAIVINSSINAVTGSAGMAIYDMSKAAVLALTRSLAVEYGGQGIRVNAVCPGNTITDFHINKMAEKGISVEEIREMTKGYALLQRAAEPAEIANAIYFLASDEASFITGQALCVDGGFSVTGGHRA
jgi:meso-butanediol dehydrogenase/(S,S)-butanediol dehydrogenase/diacetyl reductase